MGLRQTLPVHKNNIVFIKNRADKGGLPEAGRQPEITGGSRRAGALGVVYP